MGAISIFSIFKCCRDGTIHSACINRQSSTQHRGLQKYAILYSTSRIAEICNPVLNIEDCRNLQFSTQHRGLQHYLTTYLLRLVCYDSFVWKSTIIITVTSLCVGVIIIIRSILVLSVIECGSQYNLSFYMLYFLYI
jgi:hypothetical protein